MAKNEEYSVLTNEETNDLFLRMKQGDVNAREKLILSNMRLVIFFAKRMYSNGMEEGELINEGYFALEKAVDTYDEKLGKFSSYASPLIRSAIRRVIDNKARLNRLPVYIEEKIRKMDQVIDNFSFEFSRNPTPDEIAHIMEISTEELLNLLGYVASPISLDIPIGEDGDLYLKDIIQDRECSVEESVIDKMDIQEICRAIEVLPDDLKKEIIKLRFGFRDGISHSLKETANILKIHRSKVKEEERRALKELKLILHNGDGEY